jgi:hypothetical protein
MKGISCLLALVVSLSCGQAYELHEWGTFTTVSGSDGVLLSGLQREEEALPRFVHAHFGFENGQPPSIETFNRLKSLYGFTGFEPRMKGLGRRPVSGVTVKMETPVIYFHSSSGFHAQVKVGFEGGTISQWYPERSGGEVLPEPPPPAKPPTQPMSLEPWRIDFLKPYRGSIEWKVEVLSPEQSRAARTFKPDDTLNWLRARVPEANVVRTPSGETENYLFYRGLGHFSPGLHTIVSQDESLLLRNDTGAEIPYLLVFEKRADSVLWKACQSGLKAGQQVVIRENELAALNEKFPEPVYDSLKSGLLSQGLLESEASAMIQTWWTSYFESEGLRVFWVLPRAVTDRILPLDVKPAPEKTVRVLVGRSEILRPRAERMWLDAANRKSSDPFNSNPLESHRFGLAIQERLATLKGTAAK